MAQTWTSISRMSLSMLGATLLLGGVGCRAPAPAATGSQTPELQVEPGPPAPSHGLPVVDLAVSWAPPRIVAGDLEALRAALVHAEAIEVRAPPRFVRGERVAPMSKLMQVVAPGRPLEVQAIERLASFGPEPFVVQLDGGAVGGAPHYQALPRTWGATATDRTTLMLADAPLDAAAWRALPSHTVGSCQPVVDALALSQEQALAYLEAFLDHADGALQRQFRAALSVGLPREFKRWEDVGEAPARSTPAQRCGHLVGQQLSELSACIDGGDTCALAPRMIVIGGARVGMPAFEWELPAECETERADASRERIEAMAAEATALVTPQLAREWTVLADRLGALTEVYDALEDVCTPRRRRFAEADLDGIRDRVARIGRLLAQEVAQDDGHWRAGTATVFVPGLGQVRELSRFEASAGTAAAVARADARALRRFALSRALCRSGYGEFPLAAAVLDGTGLPRFFGFFYEEELFCAGLSPALETSVDASG